MRSKQKTVFIALTFVIAATAVAALKSGTVFAPVPGQADDAPPVPGRKEGARPALRGGPEPERAELADVRGPRAVGRIDDGAPLGPAGTTVIYPLEVDLSLGLSHAVALPDGAEPIRTGANARIEGAVMGSSGQPLDATVEFLHGPNQGRTLRTDAEGRFGASDLWPGLSLVRATAPNGLTVEREVPLARLSSSHMHISLANTSTVAGTVKDERGRPIDGALVKVDGRPSYTNAEGIFSISGVPAGRPLIVVEKDGYALARRSAGLGFRTNIPPERLVITLAREASLTIATGRRAGVEGPSYAVLLPSGGADFAGGDSGFPWFMVNPIEVPASGSVKVDGLPPGPLTVRLFHRGARSRPALKTVHLTAGKTGSVTIDLDAGPTLRGTVVRDGVPVPGAIVELEAANQTVAATAGIGERNPRALLSLVTPRIPTARDVARADAKGRFEFSRDPVALTTYYVSARTARGDLVGAAAVAPGQSEVVIEVAPPREVEGQLVLRLPTSRHQGLPVEVRVNGTPRDPGVVLASEDLVIEGLERGLWMLEARWDGKSVLTQTSVQIDEGATEVRVPLLPEGAIAGQSAEERRRAQSGGPDPNWRR